MPNSLKKWFLRLVVSGIFIIVLLIAIVLNPGLLYANKTIIDNYTIYHNLPLDERLQGRLKTVNLLLRNSSFCQLALPLDLCLNDGSFYPYMIEQLQGPGFAWGFYDKVVLNGQINAKSNRVSLNGYRWNLEELLAHEFIHCYQFEAFGFWHSNPVANHPEWKWEGFAEYVARNSRKENGLVQHLARWLSFQEQADQKWAFTFHDGTIIPASYLRDWLLVMYCLDVKQMTYEELLMSNIGKEEITAEMMEWFQNQEREGPKKILQ